MATVLAVAAPAGAAGARTIYLKAGAGSGDGSSARPYNDIGTAARALRPGDTLVIRAGTYRKTLQILNKHGNGRWTTIRGEAGARIAPTGADGVLVSNSSYIRISGLELIGHGGNTGSGVLIRDRSHHVDVTSNNVHAWAGSGVAGINSGSIKVTGNHIHNNTMRSPHQTSGISIFKPYGPNEAGIDNVISGNTVHDNVTHVVDPNRGIITDGNCVILDLFSATNYQGHTLVERNLCVRNGGRGIHLKKSSNATVINNTLWHNQRTQRIIDGELVSDGGNNNVFRNNLIKANNGKGSINIHDAAPQVSGNKLVDPGNNYGRRSWNQAAISGRILANPGGAVNNPNFTPVAGSPAIGTGAIGGSATPPPPPATTTTTAAPTTTTVAPTTTTRPPATTTAVPPTTTPPELIRSESNNSRTIRVPQAVAFCGDLQATIVGSGADDVLIGTPGPDIIAGGSGDDVIKGLGGDDIICGGDGNDLLIGGMGADLILGQDGRDRLEGNGGADDLRGGDGRDRLIGGPGPDQLAGNAAADTLVGNGGNDKLIGQTGADRLLGKNGNDLCVGGPADDRFVSCERQRS
jgi:parallel beta-helix repeat protein